MKVKQLKKYIIKPSLEYVASIDRRYKKIASPEAVKLMLMTAAVESDMGKYIVQNNNKMHDADKALGIYQIEKATINFVLNRRSSKLIEEVKCMTDMRGRYLMNIYDLGYSTIMARLVYWYKTKDPIPNIDNNEGLWKYYKKWYNSSRGDTTKEEFYKLCKKHKLL